MQIILRNCATVHRPGDIVSVEQLVLNGHDRGYIGFPHILIILEMEGRRIEVSASELKAAIEALEKVATS